MASITKRSVDALPMNSVLWDDAVKGFGVRRQRRDAVYVLKHQNKWTTIGRHGSPWTPDTARKEAIRLLGLAVTASPPVHSPMFADVMEHYLRVKICRPATFKEVSRFLRRSWEPLHDREIASITRREVATLLEAMTGGRRGAQMSLSAFFKWAWKQGYFDAHPDWHNPLAGVDQIKAGKRERVLTDDELAAVWHAVADLGDYGRVVRLLILTGQRRNEVALMTDSEVVGDVWTIPGARTKNKRTHVLPLLPSAKRLLRDGLPFVVGSWMWPKTTVDRRVMTAPWTLHDLRRSVATGMANLGILPHVVEAVLNHVSGSKAGVAGIYNRARYADEVRDALSRWAAHVSELIR